MSRLHFLSLKLRGDWGPADVLLIGSTSEMPAPRPACSLTGSTLHQYTGPHVSNCEEIHLKRHWAGAQAATYASNKLREVHCLHCMVDQQSTYGGPKGVKGLHLFLYLLQPTFCLGELPRVVFFPRFWEMHSPVSVLLLEVIDAHFASPSSI